MLTVQKDWFWNLTDLRRGARKSVTCLCSGACSFSLKHLKGTPNAAVGFWVERTRMSNWEFIVVVVIILGYLTRTVMKLENLESVAFTAMSVAFVASKIQLSPKQKNHFDGWRSVFATWNHFVLFMVEGPIWILKKRCERNEWACVRQCWACVTDRMSAITAYQMAKRM